MALDPAGPIFDWHPPEYRLDKNDAKVVHILHTSAPALSIKDPIGDVDIYVNGMWDNQPRTCPNSRKIKCGCPLETNWQPDINDNQGH